MTTALEPAVTPSWSTVTVQLPILHTHPSHPARRRARRIVDALFAKLRREIDADYARMHAEIDRIFASAYASVSEPEIVGPPAPAARRRWFR